MESFIVKLNYSLDDFNDLEKIESFITDIEDNTFEWEQWIKPIGEQFQVYGEMRRSRKPSEKTYVYEQLITSYERRNQSGYFDLAVPKFLIDEGFDIQHLKPASFETILLKFNDTLNYCNSYIDENSDENPRRRIWHYFTAISIGRKSQYSCHVNRLSKEQNQMAILVAHMQVLRVIWKLEDYLAEERNLFKSTQVSFLLVRAYALINLKCVNLTAKYYKNIIANNLKEVSESNLSQENLFSEMKKHIIETGDLDISSAMSAIMKSFKISATQYENDVLVNRFIDSLLTSWCDSVVQIISKWKSKDFSSLLKISESISSAQNLLDIEWILEPVNIEYLILTTNHHLLDVNRTSKALQKIYDSVYNIMMQQNESIKLEGRLWTSLLDILKNAYKEFDDIVSKLSLLELTKNLNHFPMALKAIIEANLDYEQFNDLKLVASELLERNVMPVLQQNYQTIVNYVKPLQIIESLENDKKTFTIYGKNVQTNKVMQKLIEKCVEFRQVNFIGIDVLHVDSNLDQKDYHGKSIFILANKVVVHGVVEWNVCGNDTKQLYENDPGQHSDGAGIDGKDGFCGESGGSFVVLADKIANSENWCMKVNGGQGSRGQNGGAGRDGEDGEKFTVDRLKKIDHIKTRTVLGIPFSNINTVLDFGTIVEKNFKRNIYFLDGIVYSKYYIYENDRGSRLHTLVFESIYKEERLSLIQGVDGELGKIGGIFGFGGEGGYPGEVLFLNTSGQLISTDLNVESNRGKFGIDGDGGLSGQQGDNGSDAGFFSTVLQDYKETYSSGQTSKLDIGYSGLSEIGSNNVYLTDKQLFAHICHQENARSNVNIHKSRNSKKTIRDRQVQALAIKQSPILWQSLLQKHLSDLKVNLSGQEVRRIVKKEILGIKNEGIQKSTIDIMVKRPIPAEVETNPRMLKEKTSVEKMTLSKKVDLNHFIEFMQEHPLIEVLKKFRSEELDDWEECGKLMEDFQKIQVSLHHNFKRKVNDTFGVSNKTPLHEVIQGFISMNANKELDEVINSYCHDFRIFNNDKKKSCSIFFDIFSSELRILPPSIQELYVKGQTQKWAIQEFEEIIKDMPFIRCLYKNYQLHASITYDWKKCLANDKVYEEFFQLLSQNAPLYYFSRYQEYYRNISNHQMCKVTNRLLMEKYKCAAISQLTYQDSGNLNDNLSALNESERLKFLEISESFECQIESSSLGRLKDFFDSNNKQKSEVLLNCVQELLTSTSKNIIIEPFIQFLEEKISCNSDEKLYETYNFIYSEYLHLVSLEPVSELNSDFNIDHVPTEMSFEVTKFEEKLSAKLINLWLCKSLKNEDIKRAFLKGLESNGISSTFVRNLIAKLFKVTIVFYKEINGEICLWEEHSAPESKSETLRIFSEDKSNKYYTMKENETNIKMFIKRKKQESFYKKHLTQIDALDSKKEIDDFLKSPNDYRALSRNDNNIEIDLTEDQMIDEILKILYPTSKVERRIETLLLLQKISSLVINDSILVKTILLKFHNDGFHLHLDEFQAILRTIFGFLCDDLLFIYTFKRILMSSQQNWLPELIMMQIEDVAVDFNEQWKQDNLKILSNHNNRNIIVLLNEKLQEKCAGLKLETLSNIIEALDIFTLSTLNFLEDLQLKSWKFAITEKYWSTRVEGLFKNQENTKNVQAVATFHLCSLQVQHDTMTVKALMDVIESKQEDLIGSNLLLVLAAFSNSEVGLTNKILFELHENSLEKWIRLHKLKDPSKNWQRSIKELAEIIKYGPTFRKSGIFHSDIGDITHIIQRMPARKCQAIEKEIQFFTEDDIRNWRRNLFKKKTTDVGETLAVVARSFQIVSKDFSLRDTQLLTILLFSKSKNALLAQVSTGEGKSYIAVAFAIIRVLYGEKVDIITSSNLLAARDANDEANIKIFDMFDVTIGHNCNDDTEIRKEVYCNKDVIYGSLGNFQRDHLLDKFKNTNITASRPQKTVIVDEIDSMLLDKGW